jgi:hypothetical protein
MDIPYHEEIKVLGIHIQRNTHATAIRNWNMPTSRIRAQAQEMYEPALELDQRIRCIHEYLLARPWHMAQILPPDENRGKSTDYIMVPVERRNISGTVIHIAKDEEGGRFGYDTPSRKVYDAVFSPYEGAKQED